MATRDSYAGDPAAGDVLTAANFKKLPGGWINYDSTTTTAGPTSGTTDLTVFSTSVNVDATRRLKITFHCQSATISVANDTFTCRLVYDGGIVNRTTIRRNATAHEDGFEVTGVVDTTTAGAKTIAAIAVRTGGTGTLTLNAVAAGPLFMLVEDIGPSS